MSQIINAIASVFNSIESAIINIYSSFGQLGPVVAIVALYLVWKTNVSIGKYTTIIKVGFTLVTAMYLFNYVNRFINLK